MDRIPSIQRTREVASHLRKALLKKLEVRRFGDKEKKKKPRGMKIPAGQSHSVLEEEEEVDVDKLLEEDEQSSSDTEEDKEETSEEGELSEEDELAEELPDLPEPRKNLTAYVVAIYEGQ